MPPSTPQSQRFAFDRFELDLRSGELLKDGRRLRLQAQPFQLLALLLERPGEVVTRDEICEKLWAADTFVDFDHSLGTAVNKIREALSDSADHPRFVETMPRRGYRFIGKLNGANGSAVFESQPAPSDAYAGVTIELVDNGIEATAVPTLQKSGQQSRRVNIVLLVMVCLAALLLSTVIFFRRIGDSHLASRAASIHSIAVLPLENLSGNPAQDYLADSMTDELITQLARIKGLRVISRTSVMQFKGAHRPLKDIARELGVEGILEGSVLNSNGRVRVTVQLVHAASDTHVWAQSYIRDLSDLLLLQQELAENVAKEVHSAALPPKPSRKIAPEAHDAYLRGQYNWFTGSKETVRESFEKAIQLQPDYAAAYSGLSDYYTAGAVEGILVPKEALPKGEALAQKALQLDDSVAEAHNSMAATYLFYRWNWKEAEKESRRAIELNPNFAEAYHLYAYVLLAMNRNDEAVAAQRTSQELDPFARPWALGYVLACAGKYEEASREFRQRIEALPRNAGLRYDFAQSLSVQGKEQESMEQFAEALRLGGEEKAAGEVLIAYRKGGNRGIQEWRLASLKQMARKQYVSPLEFASACARLGQNDEVFRWLEKAFDDHVPLLVRIQQDPDLNSLHSDPRYQVLIKRIGLPASF
jgi:TolB-like protein/DNA-binding winged helix-turn-helix (wHTH) protein/Tfp pilus assembly protein PilF